MFTMVVGIKVKTQIIYLFYYKLNQHWFGQVITSTYNYGISFLIHALNQTAV